MSKQRPIKLKIDVSKILKDHLYQGAKGKYLDCVVWPNKNGTGQHGDTHYIVQELNRAARDAGERGPIIGNATVPQNAPRQQQQAKPVREPDEFGGGMEDDNIAF